MIARDLEEGVAFTTLLLDARSLMRDHLLQSTPRGWGCRRGRAELVWLLLAPGADPVERDLEPWATPLYSLDRPANRAFCGYTGGTCLKSRQGCGRPL